MEDGALDRALARGRMSARARVARVRSKGFHIAQCARRRGRRLADRGRPAGSRDAVLRAGRGRGLPRHVLRAAAAPGRRGHPRGRRRACSSPTCWRSGSGPGWWQLVVVVALSMTVALLLDGGQLLVIQAMVQSIIISALAPAPGEALVRVSDAVIGGLVALVAATVVPAAPLRTTTRTGGGRGPQGLGAAARRRRGDGRRGARPGDGAARGRPGHRRPDPGAADRRPTRAWRW